MKVIKVTGRDMRTGETVACFFDWYEESGRLGRKTYWSSHYGSTFCKTIADAENRARELAQGKGVVPQSIMSWEE